MILASTVLLVKLAAPTVGPGRLGHEPEASSQTIPSLDRGCECGVGPAAEEVRGRSGEPSKERAADPP
eukprot:3795921-Rhodomonas_salina.6